MSGGVRTECSNVQYISGTFVSYTRLEANGGEGLGEIHAISYYMYLVGVLDFFYSQNVIDKLGT